jgi:hypothetical protein
MWVHQHLAQAGERLARNSENQEASLRGDDESHIGGQIQSAATFPMERVDKFSARVKEALSLRCCQTPDRRNRAL